MYRALLALLLLLLAGCASMDSGTPDGAEDRPSERSEEETQPLNGQPPEETGEGSRSVAARELASGNFGQGSARPEVRVARSASALTEDLGEEVGDRGEGVYLAALWGRKNTGGYSVGLAGAQEREGGILIRLSLEEPPEDAMVTQAITYPYAFIFVPDAAPQDISLADQNGRELDWPLVEAGG